MSQSLSYNSQASSVTSASNISTSSCSSSSNATDLPGIRLQVFLKDSLEEFAFKGGKLFEKVAFYASVIEKAAAAGGGNQPTELLMAANRLKLFVSETLTEFGLNVKRLCERAATWRTAPVHSVSAQYGQYELQFAGRQLRTLLDDSLEQLDFHTGKLVDRCDELEFACNRLKLFLAQTREQFKFHFDRVICFVTVVQSDNTSSSSSPAAPNSETLVDLPTESNEASANTSPELGTKEKTFVNQDMVTFLAGHQVEKPESPQKNKLDRTIKEEPSETTPAKKRKADEPTQPPHVRVNSLTDELTTTIVDEESYDRHNRRIETLTRAGVLGEGAPALIMSLRKRSVTTTRKSSRLAAADTSCVITDSILPAASSVILRWDIKRFRCGKCGLRSNRRYDIARHVVRVCKAADAEQAIESLSIEEAARTVDEYDVTWSLRRRSGQREPDSEA